MNKKIILTSTISLLIVLLFVLLLLYNKDSKSYENYIKEPSVTLEEEDSDIIEDDYSIVQKYYIDKGIDGKLYSWGIDDESVPDSVLDYDVTHYYELASNGVIYYSVVVNGQVIEIEE